MDLDEYQALKRKADNKQREADRAAGAVQQLTARLQTEFACDNKAEMEKLLAKLGKKAKAARVESEERLKAFEVKWQGKLGDGD